eukprot:Skav207288  [mRNA]  locus=scaffold434:228830:231244:- [translate_table: standard]
MPLPFHATESDADLQVWDGGDGLILGLQAEDRTSEGFDPAYHPRFKKKEMEESDGVQNVQSKRVDEEKNFSFSSLGLRSEISVLMRSACPLGSMSGNPCRHLGHAVVRAGNAGSISSEGDGQNYGPDAEGHEMQIVAAFWYLLQYMLQCVFSCYGTSQLQLFIDMPGVACPSSVTRV